MSDHSAAKAMWEERYGADEYAYGTEPNDFLKVRLPRNSGHGLCSNLVQTSQR